MVQINKWGEPLPHTLKQQVVFEVHHQLLSAQNETVGGRRCIRFQRPWNPLLRDLAAWLSRNMGVPAGEGTRVSRGWWASRSREIGFCLPSSSSTPMRPTTPPTLLFSGGEGDKEAGLSLPWPRSFPGVPRRAIFSGSCPLYLTPGREGCGSRGDAARREASGFPRIVRDGGRGEGTRPSRFPSAEPPGGRIRGRRGPAGEQWKAFFPRPEGSPQRGGGNPRRRVPGPGWSLQRRKFPGTAACVTAGLGPRGGLAGAGGDPGAGRWAALAAAGPAARGAALEASPTAPGRRRGGGLRGPGVSCVPARSPRRGRGGRRRRGRGCSAPDATSHEQRPWGRPCCRWQLLSRIGRQILVPQHLPQPAPSRLEVRAGTAEGWRGAARRGPRARSSRCAGAWTRPASPASLPPPGFRAGGVWSPAHRVIGPWSHMLLGLRDPPVPTPPTQASGRGSPAWRQAQRGRSRFCGLGGGGEDKMGPAPGAVVVLYYLTHLWDPRACPFWSALPLLPPSSWS